MVNTDPLYERRILTRLVKVESRNLQRNVQVSILSKLKSQYEGMCTKEGYIQKRSIDILDHSVGRVNLIKGGIEYSVKFQAEICLPHPGQIFQAEVSLKSKIGIHIDYTPLKVLLPRDLHIGNTDFESVADKQSVLFEVIGSKFQQGDEDITVIGKLHSIVKEQEIQLETVSAEEPVIAAPVNAQDDGNRRVVIPIEVASNPKKKRLVRADAS
jgi:DNA-directed RNA polymerase subunit E'/Rpb7